MRAGMQVADSAIDRVLRPSAPARRFDGVIDAAFALAIGSVCAFGLTLGPAPLNTVAISSAAAADLSPQTGSTPPGIALPLVEEDTSVSRETDAPRAASPEPGPEPRPTAAGDTPSQTPPASRNPASLPTVDQNSPDTSRSETLIPPAPLAGITPVLGVGVVEAHRVAAGLGEFVSADACVEPVVHAKVAVTLAGTLAPGLVKLSLAPDPAYATASREPGAVSVTVHACR